ncbi:hypothetical protein KA078_03350, partial [Candidatus Woesebacteria bacterium]|nr:hypothetical protein [Candidatus Woesebacteria bacterium]
GQKISSASTERKRLWCQWQIQLCLEKVGKITEEPTDSLFDSDAFARTIQELVASGNEQALTALSSLQKVIASQAKLAVESVVLRFTNEMMKKKTDAYAVLSSQKGGEEDQVAHGLSLKKAIWTPEELNKKYSECHAALIRFRQLVMDVGATIDSREGIKVLQDIANGLQPIAESEYTALYEASLKLANRDGYLFHGTTNPEARASILSKGMLFSRKRQEEIYGESHFAMQEAAEAAGLSTALIKQDDAEYEQLCFSLDHPLGTYTSLGRTTQDNPQNVFAVALPAATAFRNYGFFSSDGIHFFSLPDPQQGFELSVNRSNCKLVCDEAAAQQIIRAGNQELLQQYRDVLFNSAEALPKESPAHKIAQARIVPTGILMDKPGSKRSGMVYRLT